MRTVVGIFTGFLLLALAASAQAPADTDTLDHFYGIPFVMEGLANLTVGGGSGADVTHLYTADFRFVAEKTGIVDHVIWYPVWGPGYGKGTCGTTRLRVMTDDETSSHRPSGTVVGGPVSFTPNLPGGACPNDCSCSNAVVPFPANLSFGSQPSLTRGVLYHLVFDNTDVDPVNNYMSVDGVYRSRNLPNLEVGLSDRDYAALYGYGVPLPDTIYYSIAPIYSLYYGADHRGQGYIGIWPASYGPPGPVIYGSNEVEESFTVSGGNRVAASVSVKLVPHGTPSNPTVSLTLGCPSGTTIESGVMSSFSSATPEGNKTGTYAFATNRTLSQSSCYQLIISCPTCSAANYWEAQAVQPGDSARSGYGFDSPWLFTDGYLQLSTDGGSTWAPWQISGTARTDLQLPFYFSLQNNDNNH